MDRIELLRRAPADARELVGVNRSTWSRWLRGESRIPDSVAALMRVLVTGELPQGGKEWDGWRFHQGLLYDPSGQWHSPATIIAWHWLRQELQTARGRENAIEAAADNVVRFPGRRSARELTAELYQRLGD